MPIPNTLHTDWLWPFSLVPRRKTAIESDVPPQVAAKSPGYPDSANEIPPAGHWVLQTHPEYGFYFAFTNPDGWHFRVGSFRYDYVDHYYTFPTVALKRLETH